MFQSPRFTAEEEWEFGELYFQKTKGEKLDFLKNGVAMNSRHQLWLQERDRQRILGDTRGSHQIRALITPEDYVPESQPLAGLPTAGINSLPAPGPLSSGSSNGNKPDPPARRDNRPQSGSSKTAFLKQVDFRSDIQMHGKSGWKALKAILDTGTKENWICQKIVDRLGLPVKNGLTIKDTTFDGTQISSGSAVDPTWCVENSSKTHQTRFHVAPKEAPFEVLFGSNLIGSGEVQFFEDDDSIQVLAGPKIKKEEQKEIEKNEAEMKAKQAKLMSQTQQVKRSSNHTRKTTQPSRSQSSKDPKGTRDKK